MRPDRIVDVVGDGQRACCQFNYKNYLISYSQLFSPGHVCVFAWEDESTALGTFVCVSQAIEWVDERVKIQGLKDIVNAILREDKGVVHCSVCDAVRPVGMACNTCGFK